MPAQADLRDVESATVLAFQYIVSSPHLMKGVQSRQALKDFADLTASAHPTKLCAPFPPLRAHRSTRAPETGPRTLTAG